MHDSLKSSNVKIFPFAYYLHGIFQEVITEKCDLEQIVFIALIGKDVVASAGKEIHNIIHYCGM